MHQCWDIMHNQLVPLKTNQSISQSVKTIHQALVIVLYQGYFCMFPQEKKKKKSVCHVIMILEFNSAWISVTGSSLCKALRYCPLVVIYIQRLRN